MSKAWKMTMALAAMTAGAGLHSAPAQAQDKYIGQIVPAGFNFCPRGSAGADGQLLPIAQYTALFSLLGTTYGGDGRTSFGLPDLRGRLPMHVGRGPGLTSVSWGERFGTETNTLTTANLAAHNHSPRMRVARINGTRRNPIDSYMARSTTDAYDNVEVPANFMATDAIQSDIVGSSTPVNNIQPSLVIRYCIYLVGVFPSRP